MAKAAATRIPRFGVDEGQFGTIVVGRRFTVDLTQSEVKSIHKTVDALRTKTGLPLVFVSPGAVETDNEDMASETFYAGLLVASALDGKGPVRVDKSLLDPTRIDTIPAEFWEKLEEKHELVLDEQDEDDDEDDDDDDESEDSDDEDEDEEEAAAEGADDEEEDDDGDEDEDDDEGGEADDIDDAADNEDEDEGPPEGVFLVPAGWAVASIYLGSTDDECLATTSSEDTFIGKHLDEETLAEIRASSKPLVLVGEYC